MTRDELIDKIAQAIAEREGFYVSKAEAEKRGIAYPTRAQRNANPGNIRRWKDAQGNPYPTFAGYVDFVSWASEKFRGASVEEISRRALEEGWRILKALVWQYINGKYTQGKAPTLQEMFRVYAPSSDRNDPDAYARFVAEKLGCDPRQRPMDLLG